MKNAIFIVLFLLIPMKSESAVKTKKEKPIDSTYFHLTKEDKLRFLDSLNKYRREIGSPELEYSFSHEELSSMRVNTIVNYVNEITYEECKTDFRKYLHYGFRKDFKTYNLRRLSSDTTFKWKGECVFICNKMEVFKGKDLVLELFNAWKSSEDHWNNMLDPDFKMVALDIKYKDGLIISVLNPFQLKKTDKKKKGT